MMSLQLMINYLNECTENPKLFIDVSKPYFQYAQKTLPFITIKYSGD